MSKKKTQKPERKLTPMMKQYFEVKEQNPDSILFFRMGDFYEIFGEDAKIASNILDITLTARHKKTANPMPMCGFPHHSKESYLAKMVKAGYKVAICDQVSDPSLPGIVERKVTQVVTAGTITEESMLAKDKSNYLVAIVNKKDDWGLAALDSSTGEFKVVNLDNLIELSAELYRLDPAEIVISEKIKERLKYKDWYKHYNWQVYDLEKWADSRKILTDHFKVNSLASFSIDNDELLIKAAAIVFQYLQDRQMADAVHINKIEKYFVNDYLVLDNATLYNLELFQNSYNSQSKGSLFEIINETVTSMGARLLQKLLLRPLNQKELIELRLNAVEEIQQNNLLRQELRAALKNLYDLERLVGRVGTGRANPKDLVQIKLILQAVPDIKTLLSKLKSDLWQQINDNLLILSDVTSFIDKALLDDPSALLSEGNIINDGYDKKVDEYRDLMKSGKKYIRELQEKEIKSTGISSLKIKFNKVFGYYIEVSKANLDAVPEHYIRKQTLVNSERYITDDLKEFEEKVLSADEKLKILEQDLYIKILSKVQESVADLQQVAQQLALGDVLASLAELSLLNNYVKPEINTDGLIEIKDGRHPVIEKLLETEYIPNDIKIDNEKIQIQLITGPNMSGKSSYLRQVALISILAHMGSFVPATKANISILDRVFTRVGASDNLSMGKSTFMVEMEETASILNNATQNSLVILDELGRGTSTYDGVSIAWSVTEYLHQRLKAKTLLATHYHELIKLENSLDRVKNYSVMVDDSGDEVVFLYKIVPGGTDQSYGLHVGKLAGLPKSLLVRAEEILTELETASKRRQNLDKNQLDLFNQSISENKKTWEIDSEVVEELKDLDLNSLTPLEALNKLNKWKNKISNL